MDQGISSLSFIDLSCLWGIPALVDANVYTAGHGFFNWKQFGMYCKIDVFFLHILWNVWYLSMFVANT